MRRNFIIITAIAALFLSCGKEDASTERCVRMSVGLEQLTKVCLTGTDSVLKSGRVWKWEDGDVLTYTYYSEGTEREIRSSQSSIDEKNPSLLHVTIKGLPEDAVFSKVVYGDPSVFGKTCIADGSIPSTLVYASGLINSEPGETNIPGVTLDHHCSYFLIYPDYVTSGKSSYQIKDIEVTGHSLSGEDKDEKLSISLYDSATRTFTPVWLSLSCKASDIVFTADYGAGKAVMASVPSAGGKCTLFEITNKAIGTSYK